MLKLAASIKPKSGYDITNSGKVAVNGANNGEILAHYSLPQKVEYTPRHSILYSIVTAKDNSLAAVSNGILYKLSISGEIMWTVQLENMDGSVPDYYSAPLACDNGEIVISLDRTILFIDSDGNIIKQIDGDEYGFDDTGHSPSLTSDGSLVFGNPCGSVLLLKGDSINEVDWFGYDVVNPSVFSDNSLAVSGYAGKGYCRVNLKGEVLWNSELPYADLVACINRKDFSAVGSMNEHKSCIFSPDGKTLSELDGAAAFAVFDDESWIALTKTGILKVNCFGIIEWQREIEVKLNFFTQPVVDRLGRIYFYNDHKLHCLSCEGQEVFNLEFDKQIRDFAIIDEDKMAVLCENEVYIVI